MIFAPVIITTLNRYKHFVDCIESLKENTGACNTDIFIGLDYPPEEKYYEGYLQIKQFLNNGIKGFKSVTIIERDSNFGAIKNFIDLRRMVLEKYDRYIATEDDNVFSPNFLEYINKALERYANLDDIDSVCGYSYPIKYKNTTANYLFTSRFSAWGYATWKRKNELYENEANSLFFQKNLRKLHIMMKCLINNVAALSYILTCIIEEKDILFGDYKRSIYCIIKNYKHISPVQTKVHNIGFDGSGLHCARSLQAGEIFNEGPIDNNPVFTFIGTPRNLSLRERIRIQTLFNTKTKYFVLTLLKGIVYCLVGKTVLKRIYTMIGKDVKQKKA